MHPIPRTSSFMLMAFVGYKSSIAFSLPLNDPVNTDRRLYAAIVYRCTACTSQRRCNSCHID